MKKEQQNIRNHIVTLRMNDEEFQSMENFRKATTERTTSNYLRKLALKKPVTSLTRNQSIDELNQELILLRREINAIGNNFNQAIHKLHTLERIPEFRQWIETYEHTRVTLKKKADQAFEYIIQKTGQW